MTHRRDRQKTNDIGPRASSAVLTGFLALNNRRRTCLAGRRIILCIYRTTKAPDKGEVGGSSPPRPTIQIISKHAVILTFPLFRDLPQKTVLSTVCQLYDWPDGTTLRSIRLRRERCPVTSKDVQGSARHCKTVEGAGSHFQSVCGGVVQLVRTPACHAGGRRLESRPSRQ